jgi:tRNA(fMet)-specific endonuclease VapC
MNYLLDTYVVSELSSRQPNPAVVAWVDGIDDERMYLSVITIGEVKRGVERLPESMRKTALDDWLNHDLLVRFEGRILAVDAPVMLAWGTLYASLERVGRPMPAIDSLLAAQALHFNLRLVTRNVADFEAAGIEIVNPWA